MGNALLRRGCVLACAYPSLREPRPPRGVLGVWVEERTEGGHLSTAHKAKLFRQGLWGQDTESRWPNFKKNSRQKRLKRLPRDVEFKIDHTTSSTCNSIIRSSVQTGNKWYQPLSTNAISLTSCKFRSALKLRNTHMHALSNILEPYQTFSNPLEPYCGGTCQIKQTVKPENQSGYIWCHRKTIKP